MRSNIIMSNLVIILAFFVSCSSGSQNKEIVTEKKVLEVEQQKANSNLKQVEKINLLNGKVLAILPSGFDIMNEEMLAAKYPASNRPTLVYTNEDGSINFAFNHTANQITEDKLREVLPAFVQQFNSIYPQIQWFKKDIEKVNGKSFIVMEFITPAVDTRIYNLMYVTELEGKMLMCSFNCMESQKSEWEVKAKEALNSIEVK